MQGICPLEVSTFNIAIHQKKMKLIPKKMLIQKFWIMPIAAQEDK